MTVKAFFFPKLRTLKTWLDKCLRSPVSEGPSTNNMANVKKYCLNLHRSIFIDLLVTGKEILFKNIPPATGFCTHLSDYVL